MGNKNKCIIVCDLDGTLLQKDKTISQVTKQYLINLQQQGYLLVLASGRSYHEMQTYMQELCIPTYKGYSICGNGLEVYQGTKLIHSFDRLSIEDCSQLIQDGKHHGMYMHVQLDQHYYAAYGTFGYVLGKVAGGILNPLPIHQFYIESLRHMTFTRSILPYITKPVDKLCFIGTRNKIASWKQWVQQHYPNQYQCYDLHSYAFELVKYSVGKKEAVTWVCKQEGLSLKQVIAFGDSGNDEALLASAGVGFVMKNGYAPVKANIALHTAYSNQEDGVKKELERVLEK